MSLLLLLVLLVESKVVGRDLHGMACGDTPRRPPQIPTPRTRRKLWGFPPRASARAGFPSKNPRPLICSDRPRDPETRPRRRHRYYALVISSREQAGPVCLVRAACPQASSVGVMNAHESLDETVCVVCSSSSSSGDGTYLEVCSLT